MEKETYRSQFRMPQELFEKLKAAADLNKRSVNAELVARLEASFSTDAYMVELEKKREGIRALIVEELELRLNAGDLLKPK